MQIFKRTHSVIKPEDVLTPIYTLEQFPIKANCVTDAEVKNDLKADMIWAESSSGNIELLEVLDPNLIYLDYHNPGTVGKTWKDHHKNLFKFVSLDSYLNVLEIGGSSGLLAHNFCATDRKFNWTIIEPSSIRSVIDNRVKFIKGFFETHDFNKKFDTIVHSHCFEHSYNPLQFLTKVNSLLETNGLHYISIPNLRHSLENGYLNALNFEHVYYVDERIMEYLLTKSGFRILEVVTNEHSIFIKSIKDSNVVTKDTDFSYIKPLFEKYISNIKKDVLSINLSIKDRPFYVFGAHMFAQYLINFGLNQKQIISLLDNDPLKHNLRLYGTTHWVKSPECLREVNNPVVVVRCGAYSQEIKESLLSINPTIEIL